MYGFNETTGQSAYLPGGIHQDVILKEISAEPSKEGSSMNVLRFKFEKVENDVAQIFTFTEFPVDPKTAGTFAAQNKRTVAQQVQADQNAQGERLKHILLTFVSRADAQKMEAKSWDEFLKAYVTAAGTKYVGEKFRLKIVYRTNGFTTFPSRAFSPFIENMRSPDTLKITQYDKVTPPAPKTNIGSAPKGDAFEEADAAYYPAPDSQLDPFAPDAPITEQEVTTPGATDALVF